MLTTKNHHQGRRRAARPIVVAAALAALVLAWAASAAAAEFTVTSTSDGVGVRSLRWAIEEANDRAGNDRITFAIPDGGGGERT